MSSHTNQKQVQTRQEYWREMIAKQGGNGLSVRAFCEQNGLRDTAFYGWRKRLRDTTPARFALVEAGAAQRTAAERLELHLSGGDRLRIGPGVDAATLRTVLAVLRERA